MYEIYINHGTISMTLVWISLFPCTLSDDDKIDLILDSSNFDHILLVQWRRGNANERRKERKKNTNTNIVKQYIEIINNGRIKVMLGCVLVKRQALGSNED